MQSCDCPRAGSLSLPCLRMQSIAMPAIVRAYFRPRLLSRCAKPRLPNRYTQMGGCSQAPTFRCPLSTEMLRYQNSNWLRQRPRCRRQRHHFLRLDGRRGGIRGRGRRGRLPKPFRPEPGLATWRRLIYRETKVIYARYSLSLSLSLSLSAATLVLLFLPQCATKKAALRHNSPKTGLGAPIRGRTPLIKQNRPGSVSGGQPRNITIRRSTPPSRVLHSNTTEFRKVKFCLRSLRNYLQPPPLCYYAI
jgi:hypothetical protein